MMATFHESMTSFKRALGPVIALGLIAACATNKDEIDINKPIDATKPIAGSEASNAEKAYRKGVEDAASSNYIDATKYLEYVRNNFPYSQYASLSELALSDMAFDRDDFSSAAQGYAEFVKSHPSHPKADYASYRIGLAHFKDKASELFFYPPAFEKDQNPVRSALEALQKFEHTYPRSELLPEARKLMDECRQRIAAHTRYVADFYWKRKAWKGAAGRYLELADGYGDLDSGKVRSDALWRAAESLGHLDQPAEEKQVLQRVIDDSPNGPHRQEAEKRIAVLNRPVIKATLPTDATSVGDPNKAEARPEAGAPTPEPKIEVKPETPAAPALPAVPPAPVEPTPARP